MDIFEKINSKIPDFTKSDVKFSKFIMANIQAVEENSISRVAELAGVSTSAVLRFCKKLGYSGYSEFRFELMRHDSMDQSREGETLLNEYADLYSCAVNSIRGMGEDELIEVAKMIYEAPMVKCTGALSSGLPALKFYYEFSAMGKRVIPQTGALSPWVDAALCRDDLVILFSVSGDYSGQGMKDFCDNLIKTGCKTILVTCNPKAKMNACAGKKILLPALKLSNGVQIEAQSQMMMLVSLWAAYYNKML